MEGPLVITQDLRSRYLACAIIWTSTCLISSGAMIYFYGLFGMGTVDPFRSHFEQGLAVLRTTLVAMLASLWVIWFGMRRRRGLVNAIMRTGLAMQFSLTLYALLGWRSPAPLNLIFPSTFFAEYNWLTFIFEVAPVTSVAASLLVYFWGKSRSVSQSSIIV